MPIQADFSLARYEDGVLQIAMTPSVNIGGWSIDFNLSQRMGGTAFVTKSMASGYINGVSGITMINAGQGIFNVTINKVDTSGLNQGSYAYQCIRKDPGKYTVLSEGYLLLTY